MKKKIILISILIMIISIVTVGYAYFIKDISDSNRELTYNSNVSTISVDEAQFYEYINNYYLSSEGVIKENVESDKVISEVNKRFTLLLTDNIVLKNDIIITSDCHIDMGGYSIDLNGYQLGIRNLYAGTMLVYNGKIIDSTSLYKVSVDSPNGNVILPESEFYDQSAFIVSNEELAYSAMKYAFANIQNAGVNDFYNIVKENIDPIETRHCIFHGDDPIDSEDGCIYTYTDLQFIKNYFNNKNVVIEYSVSENEYLTVNGNVTLPSTTQDVLLTITVKVGETTIAKNVTVHILSSGDYKKGVVASVIEYLNNYAYFEDGSFVRYHLDGAIELPRKDIYFGSVSSDVVYTLYNSEKVIINSSATENDYFDYLADQTTLTMSLNSTVQYISVGYGDYTSPLLPIQGTSKSMIIDNRSYALGIIREQYGEEISIDSNYTPQPLYLASSSIMAKYDRLVSVSYSVISDDDKVYVVEPASAGETQDELKVLDPTNNPPYITQTPELEFVFVIKDADGDGTEEITLTLPIVLSDVTHGSGIDSFAQYYSYFDKEFTTNSNNHTYHDFELPISFGAKFPIYQFKIYEVTKELLDTYGITFDKDDFIGLNESENTSDTGYNGLSNVFSGLNDLLGEDLFTINIYQDSNKVDMTTMTSSSVIINDIVSTGLGRTFIDINQYLIPQEDSYYIFFYQPCESVTDGNGNVTLNIATTYDYFSLLTIPGIVRFETASSVTSNENEYTQVTGSEAFADINLYKYIWDIYSDEEWNYDSTTTDARKYGVNFILTSRLDTYLEVLKFGDNQSPVNTTYSELIEEYENLDTGEMIKYNNSLTITDRYDDIVSYKGIELLDGVEALYLCGVNVGTSSLADVVGNEEKMQIEYIAGMSGLKVLDISYNNLTDRPEGLASNIKFPTGDDNQFISKLSTLTNLEFLFINDNYFYSFSGVEMLSSLVYINIENNRFEAILINNDLFDFINDAFTEVVNGLYGNAGATNIGYFSQLKGNGVMMQGYSGGNVKDTRIQALMALEYQDRLQTGIDISNVYSVLSQNIIDYAIPEGYTILDSDGEPMSGITVTSVSFLFSTVSEDVFALTLTYNMLYSKEGSLIGGTAVTQPFEITYYVEYHVTRY